MNRLVVIAAVAIFVVAGLLTAGFVAAADEPAAKGPATAPAPGGAATAPAPGGAATAPAPGGVTTLGNIPLKGTAVKTLKGRVWSQWADNPDGEVLFGIQYWNTGEPASGTPAGRSSSDLDVRPPDPLFVCCAWGFVGGTEKNNPYAGWYHAQTTVRLAVKDKALMDQLIKASQDLVAMEVTLDGRTITGFKPLKKD